jgi:hypothetical protein
MGLFTPLLLKAKLTRFVEYFDEMGAIIGRRPSILVQALSSIADT